MCGPRALVTGGVPRSVRCGSAATNRQTGIGSLLAGNRAQPRSRLSGEATNAETGFAPHGRMRRPPPPAVQERRERAARRVGRRKAPSAPHTAGIMHEVSRFGTSSAGARRYEGWLATRACLFRSKAYHYAPLCSAALRRDEAPPHHPPPIASITSSANAVLGRRVPRTLSRRSPLLLPTANS
jgi:hypothetical protein